jgi:hypothetical protein
MGGSNITSTHTHTHVVDFRGILAEEGEEEELHAPVRLRLGVCVCLLCVQVCAIGLGVYAFGWLVGWLGVSSIMLFASCRWIVSLVVCV